MAEKTDFDRIVIFTIATSAAEFDDQPWDTMTTDQVEHYLRLGEKVYADLAAFLIKEREYRQITTGG